MICPDMLSSASVVYSVGIGGDISFDVALHRRHGVQIFAFDPTISQADWSRILRGFGSKSSSSSFRFMQMGIGGQEGTLPLTNPTERGSSKKSTGTGNCAGQPNLGRMVATHSRAQLDVSTAVVARVSTVMLLYQHRHVDLLKLDAEGGEFSIFANNSATRMWLRRSPPDQIALEFHDRKQFGICTPARRASIMMLLHACGYSTRYVSKSNEEVLLVRSAPPSLLGCP